MEFPEEPSSQPFVEETLDHEPLKFGKFKGKTPRHIAEHEKDGEQYLVWAYETVGGFDVCSHALYRDCGGTGSRAARAEPQNDFQRRNRKDLRAAATNPETGEIGGSGDRYDSRASSKAKPTNNSFDFDDDIPF
jgi:hypothetical protein